MDENKQDGKKMATIYISRMKQYPLPGQNRRFAWRWIYNISWDASLVFAGGLLDSSGADTLTLARSIAKRVNAENGGGHCIVEAWK
jgi:hypothetical protein